MAKRKKKKHYRFFLIIIFLFVIVFLYFFKFYNVNDKEKIFKNVEENMVNMDEYYIYGSYLNVHGTFSNLNYDSIDLVLREVGGTDIVIKSNFNDDDFIISDFINDGYNLNNIDVGTYYVFVRCSILEETETSYKYYSISNSSKYSDYAFYNVSNKKVSINFSNYKGIDYMEINVTVEKQPDDVYDIVIDPGHGGVDTGGTYGNYNESSITLDYSKLIKAKLENFGYKVMLTRDDDSTLSTYGKDSRVSNVYNSKAKLLISIHVNSLDSVNGASGVEIYAPNNSNLDFAKELADNIVNSTNMKYSSGKSFLKYNGVYVRTFTQSEINESKNDAYAAGYKPYNLTTDTNYYYMLRETGGIITGAYVDGRNTKYSKNEFYDSNIGIESYLIELGYLNSYSDRNTIINDRDNYVNSISNSINSYLSS